LIITRWQAQVVPSIEQMKMMFEVEGLEPQLETYDPEIEIGEHRHPFDEVRMVCSGTLLINIDGTKLLLRAGDKIHIPSNTKHSTKTEGSGACVSICAKKIF